jgi:manganese transport protein
MIRPGFAKLGKGSLLLGPAFVAAIAYVDPGNVASNVNAGARFGYLLVWVVVTANVMAGLVQYLSAKLGLVTGMSLPEAIRERLLSRGRSDSTARPDSVGRSDSVRQREPTRAIRLGYWAQAELVAIATDLAEVVGGAIALQLLFDLPLVLGGVITGAVSLAMLLIRDRRGQRSFEVLISGFLAVIALGFLAGLVVEPPSFPQTASGLIPRFAGSESVLIAAAMMGATVMPHAVYLHSGLARDRHGSALPEQRARLLKITKFDVGGAMALAGAVNLAMLLLAATILRGKTGVDTLQGAHAAVGQALGPVIALLFALGLLASGLASTAVGAQAGAMIMQGLLRKRIPLVARRMITLVPALLVLSLAVDPTEILVISQVVLSFGIPFALIPLVRLTSDRELMGGYANHRVTTGFAWLVALVIIVLNVTLIWLILF